MSKLNIILLILATLFSSAIFAAEDNNQEKAKTCDVNIYVKPGCSYCSLAKALLNQKSVKYKSVNLVENQDLARELVESTGQNTVPFVYVCNKFIGGFTELAKLMKDEKELAKLTKVAKN